VTAITSAEATVRQYWRSKKLLGGAWSLGEISAATSILEIQPDKLNRQICQEADPNDFEHKHDANHYSRPYTLE
jgi:hypothetical protein